MSGVTLITAVTAIGVAVGIGWWSRRWPDQPRRVWPYVIVISLIIAVGYAALSLWLHQHFETHGHDLGIFDQAVWKLSHFTAPITTIRRGPIMNLFGDHFDPILSLLVPFVWLFRSPAVLLIAQATLFAAVIPLLFRLGLAYRLPAWPTLIFATAFGLNPGFWLAVNFDFHELAFAPVLIIGAVLAAAEHRWRWFWAMIVLLILTKESLTLYAALIGLMIGLPALIRRTLDRRTLLHAGACIVTGIVAFFLITRLVIPSLSGSQGFLYWNQYAAYGQSPLQLAAHMVTQPGHVFGGLIDQPEKRQTISWMFASAAFLPIVNWTAWPLFLLAFGERFWSSSYNLWPLQFHYQILLAAILALSTFGVARVLNRWVRFRGLVTAAAVLVFIGTWWVLIQVHPWQRLTAIDIQARPIDAWQQALRRIPPRDPAAAQDAFVPHLSQRDRIYQFPVINDARWIILDPRAPSWPLTAIEVQQAQRELRADPRWALIEDRDALTVFRRID
ncbi:MAG: DUF2079 domain-containing protein [Candidatus Kerfeldbacteria bacterium]|nr:DUF2079 domain-containing protein [Candidatus Kerfeldbacteria bacterium]